MQLRQAICLLKQDRTQKHKKNSERDRVVTKMALVVQCESAALCCGGQSEQTADSAAPSNE